MSTAASNAAAAAPSPRTVRLLALALGLAAVPGVASWLCGSSGDDWLRGASELQRGLAEYLVRFEARDDRTRQQAPQSRFAGEWALVTHQMTALGLGQLMLAHPELKPRYLPAMGRAARKCMLAEMRDFGTRAWGGEDAMAALHSDHGHAYMGYPALALGLARLLGAELPAAVVRDHDRLVAALSRRLAASPTGLIETYPREAYPTDVAAVAGAIALHARVSGTDRSRLLARWARAVRQQQIHRPSGFVYQRMNAATGAPRDAPRGSGTALAAYFAGFADRALREQLGRAVAAHASSLWGFGGIREYADGFTGAGDVDSGPVVLGVSVAASGFALATTRTTARAHTFRRLMRTVTLFGQPASRGAQRFFVSGGPIGNALLLAMLTSGPEVAP